MSYGSAGAFSGYSPQSGARRRPLPLLSSLSGYIESWNFSDAGRRWQDTGRTLLAGAISDPVAVADPDSGTAALRLSNSGGSVRPLVSAGGITSDGNDSLAALTTGLATQGGGATVCVRFACPSSPAQWSGLVSSASAGGNDGITGFTIYWDRSGGTRNVTQIDQISFGAAGAGVNTSITPVAFGTLMTLAIFISPTANQSAMWLNGSLVSNTISVSSTSIAMAVITAFSRYEGAVSNNTIATIRRIALFSGNKSSDMAVITAIMES